MEEGDAAHVTPLACQALAIPLIFELKSGITYIQNIEAETEG